MVRVHLGPFKIMLKEELDRYVQNFDLKKLWRAMRPFLSLHKSELLRATAWRISADLAALYFSYGFASIVTFFDHYERGSSMRTFWVTLGLLGFAGVYRQLAVGRAKYLSFNAAEQITLKAQIAGVKKMLSLDMGWHEQENVGSKVKRIERGAHGMQKLVRVWIGNVTEITINFVGMIAIIASTSLFIAGIVSVYLVLFTLLGTYLTRKTVAAAHVVNGEEEEYGGLFFQAMQNIRTTKALGAGAVILDYLQKFTDKLKISIRRRVYYFQTRTYALAIYAQVVKLLSLGFIGYGISQGYYELGFLVLFNGYFNNLWRSAEELSDISQEYVVAKQAIARFSMIMEQQSVIENDTRVMSVPSNWQTIRLENVSFGYQGENVLNNISFDIKRGERVGLVGLSGAGKSTLMKLLLKEYEPTGGKIFIDNVDYADINRNSFLEKVAVVLQETEVFNLSLQENIVLAKQGQIDTEALKKSLTIAHVQDFLPKLENGLQTLIGEKGVKLSGGEKQRLGLARAVYKNPELLLLDEATSHLDTESEQKIQDSLHQFFQQVTAVVIAHRLTTVREMDKILVIEDGRLLEEGSFDDLLIKNGRFVELWSKQIVE